MESAPEIILKLSALAVLLLLNGFFTASGFALVRVRSTQIQPLAQQGHRRARVVSHVLGHLDAYLSATQLGNVMTSLGLGWIGEGFTTPLVEWLSRDMNLPTVAVHAIGFAIPFGTITALNIIIGELAPKSLAIQRPQATALFAATPLRLFYFAFKPAILALNGTANYILRLGGLRPPAEADIAHSEEELRILLKHSPEKEVSALARRLALRAFDLRKRIVRQIMLPRRQVVFLDLKRPLEENFRIARESKHTRFPLCDGGLDHVVGMAHMKDLLWMLQQSESKPDLGAIKRETFVVPETTGLERLLTTFQRSHQHMAVVVDEYGSTVGMVTIEDVIEELVGEIQDEFDQESVPVQELGGGEFLADGMAPLRVFNTAASANFHSEDVDTLSGYLVQQLGRLPAEGETFDLGGFSWTVKKMGRRRIHQLHLRRQSPQT